MPRKFWICFTGVVTMGALLYFVTNVRPSFQNSVDEFVGENWMWQVSSREVGAERASLVESKGTGIRNGFRSFWEKLLESDSPNREFELRWNDALFILSPSDYEIPQFGMLKRMRKNDPEKYERAIDFLIDGQLKSLGSREPEEFDLHDETIALLVALP